MAGVVLDDVSRVYAGRLRAVDRVSLDIRDKEFLVLVGPSGCGKSTTLRMIAGLEDVTSGQIRIGGRIINDVPPKDRDIAMVFQNYALYPHMSVYRNIAFGLELRHGVSNLRRWFWRVVWPSRAARLAQVRHEIADRVHRTAKTLGIEHLLDRLPRQLSGGERQRVALGRAMVREPAVFLFDEPLSNLDAKLRVEMRRELKQLHRRLEATMLYVTHDQVEALTLGERIAVMDRGTIQQVGAPMELYDRPKNQFVAGFLGTPPMNFIVGKTVNLAGGLVFRHGPWSVPVGTSHASQLAPAQKVVLGIRPEDISVEPGQAGLGGALSGRVTLVEPLGDETAVTVDLDPPDGESSGDPLAVSVTCKLRARANLGLGEKVNLRFDTGRVHFFDADTGVNVLEM